ncbi:hypothetical protein AGABI1DRAFT_115918, partial [Agaricus bisporus var. burnettii JB137-S8]
MATKLLEAMGKWFLEPSSNEETRGLEDAFLTPSLLFDGIARVCANHARDRHLCKNLAQDMRFLLIACQLHVNCMSNTCKLVFTERY